MVSIHELFSFLFLLSSATMESIGSVPSLTGYEIAYRWRPPPPRVCQRRASNSHGSSRNGCSLFRKHHRDRFSCVTLFPHPLLVQWTCTIQTVFCFVFVCISLMAHEPQCTRLPVPSTATLPSCLWPLRIFPSLPGSRLTNFYRDVSSTHLQLVNRWLSSTYSCFHASCYGRQNRNPLTRIKTHDFRAINRCVQTTY